VDKYICCSRGDNISQVGDEAFYQITVDTYYYYHHH